MKVLAIIFARSLDDIDPKALVALDTQTYQDYEVMVHTQPALELHPDWSMNKSLNAAYHRNCIRPMALASDAEWFLWIDSDVIISPTAIAELVNTQKPLVSGWYKKIRNNDWVGAMFPQPGVIRYFSEPQPGLIKVDMLGLGCCLIHRKILERLEWRGGTDEFIKDEAGNTYYAGNCIAYSNDAKKLGIESYMLGSVVCEHTARKHPYNSKGN